MRVLLIDNSPGLGGSIHSAATLLRSLDAKGVVVGVAASRPDLFEPLLPDGATRLPVAWPGFVDVFAAAHGLFGGGLPLLGPTFALRRFARRLTPEIGRVIDAFAPDLVHVNNLNLPNLPVVVAARDRGKPVVLHARMIRNFSGRELQSADRAAAVVCISRAVRDCLLEQSATPPDRFVVVPNGVDVDAYDPAATPDRAALDLPPGRPLVCLPGRLAGWKGQHVAIAAWRQVAVRHPRAVLALVGDGKDGYVQHLAQLAENLGLADAIHFTGRRDDLPQVLAASDLVLHASCFEEPGQGTVEAFGRVVIEAMAAGRALIATRAGGVPELVEDGVTGRLAAPNDPDDLAAKIIAALDDPTWRARAGAVARQVAEKRFAQPAIADDVIALYERAIGATRGE
jgi:glycosyltransferase involved in cell wall biosynthesis